MWQELDQGAELFSELWNADIPALAIENPVMHKYAKTRIKNYQSFAIGPALAIRNRSRRPGQC